MRAIAIDDFATTPTLHDLPVPEPGHGEVLVRVRASSINGFDRSVVSGGVKDMMEYRFPLILGMDFAGTIEAVGPDASRFAVDDRVFGVALKPALGAGAFAEYVAVSEGFGIARVPDGLDLPVAGALGLAGTAALMAVEAVVPEAGETVLVSGAKGGVGAVAIGGNPSEGEGYLIKGDLRITDDDRKLRHGIIRRYMSGQQADEFIAVVDQMPYVLVRLTPARVTRVR